MGLIVSFKMIDGVKAVIRACSLTTSTTKVLSDHWMPEDNLLDKLSYRYYLSELQVNTLSR